LYEIEGAKVEKKVGFPFGRAKVAFLAEKEKVG